VFASGDRLTTLDLAQCIIFDIPYHEFSSLNSLRYLNLSKNKILAADWLIENCTQLTSLNLSSNVIEQLPVSFMSQLVKILTSRGQQPNSETIEVDLGGNPLSCLCNATEFISWLQTVQGITFVGYDKYTCLYPNGSWPLLKDVKLNELANQCQYLPTKLDNNSACTCDEEKLERLYEIRFALAQYFCIYPSGLSMQMNLLPKRILGTCSVNLFTSGKFIGPIVAGIALLIIVTTVVVFVVVYRRKHPIKYKSLLDQCLDVTGIIGALMRALSNRQSTTPEYEYAFVAYHNDDWLKLREETILSRLRDSGIRINTENEDWIPGFARQETLLDTIVKSRKIVLVISPSFVSDDWCKYVVLQAIRRLHAVVPLVIIPVEMDESELTFRNIMEVCRPIHWSEEPEQQERIISELVARLAENVDGEIMNYFA